MSEQLLQILQVVNPSFTDKHASAPARICLPLSFITMSLALAFMWFLYPAKFDYTRTLGNSMFYYEANMLGNLPTGCV